MEGMRSLLTSHHSQSHGLPVSAPSVSSVVECGAACCEAAKRTRDYRTRKQERRTKNGGQEWPRSLLTTHGLTVSWSHGLFVSWSPCLRSLRSLAAILPLAVGLPWNHRRECNRALRAGKSARITSDVSPLTVSWSRCLPVSWSQSLPSCRSGRGGPRLKNDESGPNEFQRMGEAGPGASGGAGGRRRGILCGSLWPFLGLAVGERPSLLHG